MITYKTDDEIALLKESSLLVSKTHATLVEYLKEGVTCLDLDKIAEDFIRSNNGVPAFLNYRGFPNSLCTSVNDVVVHGIPNDTPLKNGDVISIDCGVELNGFYGDSAFTYHLGEPNEEVARLLQVTRESLYLGIEQAILNNRMGDISHAIQHHTQEVNGFGVVRELVGHGVGRNLHEKPEVPNYGRKGKGPKLKEGLVIAIEPMINMGTKNVKQASDGWTILTKDGKPSAHFEHMIAIKKEGTQILSSFEIIDEAISKNHNLYQMVAVEAN